MTFDVDETIQRLASQAMEIQDACNVVAVSNFLVQVTSTLLSYDRGGDWVREHPITRAVINKLNHLAGLEQSRTECFSYCLELERGNPIVIADPVGAESGW